MPLEQTEDKKFLIYYLFLGLAAISVLVWYLYFYPYTKKNVPIQIPKEILDKYSAPSGAETVQISQDIKDKYTAPEGAKNIEIPSNILKSYGSEI